MADETISPDAGSWRRKDLLDTDTLSREEIALVLKTAEAMAEVRSRPMPKVATLRGITVVTLFYEQSTRTRASFEVAGKAMGADVVNLTASGSSVEKGESLVDTVRTLEAIGADIIVMRHSKSGAPALAARTTKARVVNGGDGQHAHPTQALLDVFTMQQHLGDLAGKRVVIVGDILHSRVARSNLWALMALGADVTLTGPATLLPQTLVGASEAGRCRTTTDFDAAIEGADVVMALRIQKERQATGLIPSLRDYIRGYQLNETRLARAKPGALVMHPGPKNEGIEVAPSVAAGAASVIDEQVANGVAVRMAVLYLMAGRAA
ncbi:MAG: aspartate carbamoyltransferase catalytic subunit [Dehalococcoidia bacterium]|nr:aspartate carbamoyltransferase catalytic subunit [Dehalococcoidia bacterium]MCB9484659.1 aspartate carbamoyltransferase catalytic subunit [Thermoflexaceae bacterium]